MHRRTWIFQMKHSGRLYKRSRSTSPNFQNGNATLSKDIAEVKSDHHQSLSQCLLTKTKLYVMVHDGGHIPDTDHGSRTDGSWQAVTECCGKDGVRQEAIPCNRFTQKDMEEWQEQVSLATSSDSQNSTHTARRVLSSAIKQYAILRWHPSNTDSSPTAMSFARSKIWKSVSQWQSPITGSKVIKTR
jgi:hypothetical protein